MVSIDIEILTPELVTELRPLIEKNHEASGSRDPLDPDWRTIGKLDAGHAFCLHVVRDDGRAVGYCGQVMNHGHVDSLKHATVVAIYLDPAYRQHALRLIEYAEGCAAGAGAKSFRINVPHEAVRLGLLLSRYGYEPIETVMCRTLS